MSARHGAFHPLRVSDVTPLTDDAVAISFEVPPDLAADYDFVQGQHLTVRTALAGDDVRRSYSICAPARSGRLRIGVKVLPGGHFSGFAAGGLKVGDVLDVMTPTGRFNTPLDPENRKHYCAIAAGSGITPVLSILATTLEQEQRSRVTLLFANRTSRSVMFLEELEDLKDRYRGRFHLIHVLSREAQDAELLSGRLDAARLTKITETLVPAETVDDWFLCGPYPMVVELRQALLEQGVSARRVHSELFHVETTPPVPRVSDAGAGEGADVTINLDGRRSQFRLKGSDVPVLEAALRVRADAPFACRGGVCGTCRARLVEGSVDMDTNYALEPEEIDKGYVLTCQSHPTSERVVLDFDA
ncbi:MAG: phenylacetate-CoA oxygenase/reductase subunit PaaK [Actinomycetota bacterium]|nr:phenylacetate-CoA oxygenase/reductase subunit PaaK [Actinomycetota bacterium]MDQ3308124.1 phenylacetate-CoA oxygenase/reductase subunit PaaK [Actinomycetota bacterium]